MKTTLIGRLFLPLCFVLFVGASCQRSADPASEPQGDLERVEDSIVEPSTPAEPEPEEGGYEPAETGDRIEVEPEAPSAGATIQVRAGPLTFRNGCEGIGRSWVEPPDEAGHIRIRWSPREVPVGMMCTMALHSQWVEAMIDGLPSGEYLIVVEGIGERQLVVQD